MKGIGRASLQLNSTLTAAATAVVTLSISNDGISFVPFAVQKPSLYGGTTDHALFELGEIDYVFLKVLRRPLRWHVDASGRPLRAQWKAAMS